MPLSKKCVHVGFGSKKYASPRPPKREDISNPCVHLCLYVCVLPRKYASSRWLPASAQINVCFFAVAPRVSTDQCMLLCGGSPREHRPMYASSRWLPASLSAQQFSYLIEENSKRIWAPSGPANFHFIVCRHVPRLRCGVQPLQR